LPKKTSSTAKRSAALVPVPEKFAALLRLVNLLPSALRRSPASDSDEMSKARVPLNWTMVRFEWSCREAKEAIFSMYLLRRLVDDLPLELQAFILNDNYGRIYETDSGRLPMFDDWHFQPLENITLLGQSTKQLRAIIAEANERINHQVERAEAEISTENTTHQVRELPVEVIPVTHERFSDLKFLEIPLVVLANRARERLLFILAAEEILDALVSSNPNKKLRRAWYEKVTTSNRSYIYVQNDEVHQYPSVMYSFVVGLQVSRVKRCGICGDYFWAGRKDKKVCSARCGATNRKRQERQRYFEKKIGVRKRKGK